MTSTTLRSSTDSSQRGRPIVCPFCGTCRRVIVSNARDLEAARRRPCRPCFYAGHRAPTDESVVRYRLTRDVTCPDCHEVRTIIASSLPGLDRADGRSCKKCALRRWTTNRAQTFTGPSVPAARAFTPDDDAVDWVVVERLLAGRIRNAWRTTAHAERVAAVARLTAQGLGASEIAVRLDVSTRTVVRLRGVVRVKVAEAERIAAWAAAWAGGTLPANTEAEAA